jgi:hypothetical protein
VRPTRGRGPGRGSPRAPRWLSKNVPALSANQPAVPYTILGELDITKRTLYSIPFTMDRSLAAPAHTIATAWHGTTAPSNQKPPPPDASRRPTLTYRATRSIGQRLDEMRCSSVASPRQWAPYGSGSGSHVPVSYELTGNSRTNSEHQ